MNEPNEKPSQTEGYRRVGVDQFAPDGEVYYITEADSWGPSFDENEWALWHDVTDDDDDYYEDDDE